VKLKALDYTIELGVVPRVMGVLNVTPDSFWDGGRYLSSEEAIEHAREMVREGADIIDVGGESTRPGSKPIGAQEEIDRIGPVVEELIRSLDVPISIDTRRAAVARAMLHLGVHMVNDVSGLEFDQDMLDVVRQYDVPVVIMHMRGTPDNMQTLTDYNDVVADVRTELAARISRAEQAGIQPDRIVVDPGIGFSKTAEQCIKIIARLEEFRVLGKPILLGPSRKSFMGKTLGFGPEARLEPTITCCLVAACKGASIVRVHDVGPVSRALRMFGQIDGQQIENVRVSG
jgi:dihydropteroate synthase